MFRFPYTVLKKTELSLEQTISKVGAQEVVSFIQCYNYFSPLSTTPSLYPSRPGPSHPQTLPPLIDSGHLIYTYTHSHHQNWLKCFTKSGRNSFSKATR